MSPMSTICLQGFGWHGTCSWGIHQACVRLGSGSVDSILGSFTSLDEVGSTVLSACAIFKNKSDGFFCWYPELVILIYEMRS